MAILEVRNLTKNFNGLLAVDRVSFEVETGSMTAMIGPNGAGKTTVFNLITGFMQQTKGEVVLDGENISGLSPERIVQKGVSRTFQRVRLFNNMTVLENILVAMRNQQGEKLWSVLFQGKKVSVEEARNKEEALRILSSIYLLDKQEAAASDLSFGQKKLLELGKALATHPTLMLLDEPFSGLHARMIPDMISILKNLQESGMTIFFIEHNIRVVMKIASKVIILDQGQKSMDALPREMKSSSQIIATYLGQRKNHAVRSM